MCYTWRHDYGLRKDNSATLNAGMTESEARLMWQQMAQIFDNDIAPYMEIKNG